MVVAFDPGYRIGVAFVRDTGELVSRRIVTSEALAALELPESATFVVGDGTGSAAVVAALERRGIAALLQPEEGTSLIARELYFRDHPPTGLWRLVPKGLRSPPTAIDDYAAYAIALRYLARIRGPAP